MQAEASPFDGYFVTDDLQQNHKCREFDVSYVCSDHTGLCPQGWTLFNSRCYITAAADVHSFSDAVSACEEKNAHLVSVHRCVQRTHAETNAQRSGSVSHTHTHTHTHAHTHTLSLSLPHSPREEAFVLALANGTNAWLGLDVDGVRTQWLDGSPFLYSNWNRSTDLPAGSCAYLTTTAAATAAGAATHTRDAASSGGNSSSSGDARVAEADVIWELTSCTQPSSSSSTTTTTTTTTTTSAASTTTGTTAAADEPGMHHDGGAFAAVCRTAVISADRSCACTSPCRPARDSTGRTSTLCETHRECPRAVQRASDGAHITVCDFGDAPLLPPSVNVTCHEASSEWYTRPDGICGRCLQAQECTGSDAVLVGTCSERSTPRCVRCATGCTQCVAAGADGDDGDGDEVRCLRCSGGRFLSQLTHQCVPACEAGFYPNTTTSTCEPCHDSCARCVGAAATQCTRCSPADERYLLVTASGTRALDTEPAGKCVSTCPASTFRNREDYSCTACSACNAATEFQALACSTFLVRVVLWLFSFLFCLVPLRAQQPCVWLRPSVWLSTQNQDKKKEMMQKGESC